MYAGGCGRVRDERRMSRSQADRPPGQGRQVRGTAARRPSSEGRIVFGKHSVRSVFLARPASVRRLVLREGAAGYLQEFVDRARALGIEPEYLRSGEFLRAGGLHEDEKHQGVFVVADPLPVLTEYDFDRLGDDAVVIVLDQLSNPQNFGSIIRSAAFFGVDGVVWLRNRAADIDETVSRIAVGGTELVTLFRVTNLVRALEQLKVNGFWIYGFDERGDRELAATEFDPKTAVVIGAEGGGLRQRTKQFCDELIKIEGGRPGLTSLNASVAAGVVMAEIHRQR
jgi:23S rRNA (guanosine2251-2'-O)-methyltransferase